MITSRTKAWSLWAIASLFYAYQYVIRVLPNILMPEIMDKFQMDASLFGQFSGIYYIGYIVAHLPIGLMLDRIGPKYVMPACVVLTATGLLPIIYTEMWAYPILGRFIIGVGSSGAILGVFKILRITFQEKYFPVMLGVSVTVGLLGAIYGGQPVNLLLNSFGWQTVLQTICYSGLALAFISFLIIPEIEKDTKKTTPLQDIKNVMANPLVVIICLLGGLMVGPLEGFADAWSVEFFRSVYGLSEATASTLPSFVFLGTCFGAPFLSFLAAKTTGYYEVTILSAILMLLGFLGFMFFPLSVTWVSVVLTVIGILCGYQILVIYKASTYAPNNLTGITTAFANMIIMAFGYVFHTSIGKTMDVFWDGTMEGSRKIYSADAFINGVSIIP
ncbi:MAG: MFS transporter, partial [bacterium]|nr:MFS transporter [bacterium]